MAELTLRAARAAVPVPAAPPAAGGAAAQAAPLSQRSAAAPASTLWAAIGRTHGGGLAAAAAALAAAGAAAVAGALVRKAAPRRAGAARRRALRDGSESRQVVEVRQASDSSSAPANLYELLGVDGSSTDAEIKKAYYKMQKICHPDVAGPEGEEMCILLNDAYDVLSNPQAREAYNEQLALTLSSSESLAGVEVSADLGPTWQWSPKIHRRKPQWSGMPRSRSKWERLAPEDRGQKHYQQKFVFVNEFECIACRNCCEVAPQSFCIDIESGRARAHTQWGNSEEYLDYAVTACPVDCISWVSREELQVLEHVSAERMFKTNGELPCPMSVRQGMVQAENPWEMAEHFQKTWSQRKARHDQQVGHLQVAADKFRRRIVEVFTQLSSRLRQAILGKA